jgi:hypothetical protein
VDTVVVVVAVTVAAAATSVMRSTRNTKSM